MFRIQIGGAEFPKEPLIGTRNARLKIVVNA